MKEILKYYKDFPKEGIIFVDIIPFLQNKAVFKQLTAAVAEACTAPNIIAPEARGFLFAAPLLTDAEHIENIIPVRKSGKLPFAEGDLHEVLIQKEYGFDKLYYRLSDIAAGKVNGDIFEVTILDDVLATGGTAEGLANSLNAMRVVKDGKEYGVKVKEFVFIVEIADLGGAERLKKIAPVRSISVI
jgi:adenine phosphoribosyltransferase